MEEQKELTFNYLYKRAYLYEGGGNRLLIVHLPGDFSWEDALLRKNLAQLGLNQKADSVLVLTGNPQELLSQGYHLTMDVFEPRGRDNENPNLVGSWSTMCGNGVRAAARYLVDRGLLTCLIKTNSGYRSVAVLSNNQFQVCMGKFSTRRRDLDKYVRNYDFRQLVSKFENIDNRKIIVGLNGDGINGRIDGEPHLVIFVKNNVFSMNQLVRLTNKIGPLITSNKDYFPEGINTSSAVLRGRSQDMQEVIACTFERGVEYITQSCGTAATVIGSYLLSNDPTLSTVHIKMPGGILRIEGGTMGAYYMTGSANPLFYRVKRE